MEDDYTIKALSQNFAQHAKFFEEQCIQQIEEYAKNNPNSELPKHFRQGFNLPRALSVMCCEIERLKQKL